MKKFLALVILATILVSCGGSQSKEEMQKEYNRLDRLIPAMEKTNEVHKNILDNPYSSDSVKKETAKYLDSTGKELDKLREQKKGLANELGK